MWSIKRLQDFQSHTYVHFQPGEGGMAVGEGRTQRRPASARAHVHPRTPSSQHRQRRAVLCAQ